MKPRPGCANLERYFPRLHPNWSSRGRPAKMCSAVARAATPGFVQTCPAMHGDGFYRCRCHAQPSCPFPFAHMVFMQRAWPKAGIPEGSEAAAYKLVERGRVCLPPRSPRPGQIGGWAAVVARCVAAQGRSLRTASRLRHGRRVLRKRRWGAELAEFRPERTSPSFDQLWSKLG